MILYGERGVGKTSLANLLSLFLYAPGVAKVAAHINCSAQDSFEMIWGTALKEIISAAQAAKIRLPRPLLKLVSPIL